MLSL
ncbi:hypothetical protein VCHENC02_5727A, partial [Vibrio harveyi]|jgi:hypothetical protein